MNNTNDNVKVGNLLTLPDDLKEVYVRCKIYDTLGSFKSELLLLVNYISKLQREIYERARENATTTDE